ncbi:MAG: DUF2202 domain-containing protein [Firmicutes bacterium]|nr:DUF2202 domain-containing protein [Bacillota bacterium]
MSKKLVLFVFLGLVIGSFIFIGIGVNASSEYVEVEGFGATALSDEGVYSLEEMLTYAIQDEYLAQATYAAIIDAYGDIKPFSKIILAEQTHIDSLLSLFETYGIEVPINDAAQYVVLPESISSAIATGVEAETLNIALYEVFLNQSDLPDDVRTVFEYLQAASQNHLAAFSKDRLFGAGYDLGNMIRNQFKKGSGQGQGKQGQNQSNNGVCVN